MTPDVTLAEVRARLEQMVQMCRAVQAQALHYPEGPLVERLAAVWSMLPTEACYIAAASPDLLIRVAREALNVLDRHDVMGNGMCEACWMVELSWPCLEVKSVFRAWQP